MISVATKRRATLAIVGALSVVALAPAAAHADRYVVDHCKNWDTNAGAVAFPLVSGTTANDCGAGGGLHKQVLGPVMGPDTSVRIDLSIPADRPNITIERVLTSYSAPPQSGSAAYLTLYMHGQMIRNDLTPAAPTVDSVLPPGIRQLAWVVYCAAANGSTPCTFTDGFVLNVFKSRLFLNESVAPTLTVTGGTLIGTSAKTGQGSLTFDANDMDSGVSSVTVELGSTVVGAIQYPCAFNDWSVCQRDRTSQLLVDTTRVPDGNHELRIAVRDAANNTLTRSLGTIAVANGRVGSPNGANPFRLAKITARFARTRARSRRLRYGSRPTISGTLVNEHGQPISGAAITVLQRRRQAGADPSQIATITTAPDGRFSYKLPAGPSRTIAFAYSTFTGDPKPTATSTLRTIVRAIVSARIAPRSPRAGQQITLTGRLRLLPRAGIEIKIQPREGRRWYTFGTVKTTRSGRFRWRYRFKPSKAGQTFAFRARVDSPIYPFASGNSKLILVHVR